MANEMVDERYQYSRAGHLGPEQMRALHMMQEQFARHLTHTVSAWLRSQFVASSLPNEQMTFGAFLESVSDPAYVCSLHLEPAGANGVVQVGLELVSPIVDLLLGGTGRASPIRELTEIEEAIVFSLCGMVVKEWNKTWAPTGAELSLDKREREGQLQRIHPPQEKLICLSVEIAMPESRGRITLSLPAVVMSSVLRKMISQSNRRRRQSDLWRERTEACLMDAKIPVILRLPVVTLSATVIQTLTPETVLQLPLARDTPAELLIGDTVAALAIPVRSGEHRGARITSVIAMPAATSGESQEETEPWTT